MTQPQPDATIARVIRRDIQDMHAYAVQPSAGFIKLDAMENPYPLPQAVQHEIAELVIGAAVNRYPDPQAPQLKARLRPPQARARGVSKRWPRSCGRQGCRRRNWPRRTESPRA